jgi:hypothetical protein
MSLAVLLYQSVSLTAWQFICVTFRPHLCLSSCGMGDEEMTSGLLTYCYTYYQEWVYSRDLTLLYAHATRTRRRSTNVRFASETKH